MTMHVAILFVGMARILNSHPFNISKIGTVTQYIGVGSQVLSVTTLSALGFVFQKVAADKFLRRRALSSVLITVSYIRGILTSFLYPIIRADYSGLVH